VKIRPGTKNCSPPPAASLPGFLFIICATIALPASSGVYKWVDESGRTHYSDKPRSEKAESVQIERAPGPDPLHNTHMDKQRRLLRVFDEERQQKKQRQAEEKTAKLKREASCSQARKTLQAIKNASFLYKKSTDPKNPVVYSDKERDKITEDAKNAVQQWCN